MAVYKNADLPFFLSTNAHSPAAKPERKKRCVARTCLGRYACERQMVPHAVEKAPVTKVEERRARARRRWRVVSG